MTLKLRHTLIARPRRPALRLDCKAPGTVAIAAISTFAMLSVPADAQVSPEADELLRSMSAYLSDLRSFSTRTETVLEYLTNDGRKLQLTGSGMAQIDRDQGVRFEGRYADHEVVLNYDLETYTLFDGKPDAWLEVPLEGDIDDLLNDVRLLLGTEAIGGSDLLYNDPYDGLMLDVFTGDYIGTSWIDGTEVHHISYRSAEVDWQLWIRTGPEPAPVRYVITSKWVAGAPEFSVNFVDFRAEPNISPETFQWEAPETSREITKEELNAVGFSIIN